MNKTCLFLLAAIPGLLDAQASAATSYVINDVTVIDVDAGRTIPAQRVVITGSRIAAMGASASTPAPQGATIVNGAGKYLIPGLWDMHVHAAIGAGNATPAFTLFLANGITGVRDMASGVEGTISTRAATADGTVLGPRIVAAGVLVDGTPIVYPAAITLAVGTPDEARKAVDSLVNRGVNFIKAYEMLRPEVYMALAERARARGVPYAGHLPLMVKAEDAVRAGHKSFEHLRNLEVACSSKADSLRAVATEMIEKGQGQQGMPLRAAVHRAIRPRAYETYDEEKCTSLIRLMAQAGAWQTPNLVLTSQQAFQHDTTQFFQRWVQYLPEPMRTQWRRVPDTSAVRPADGPRSGLDFAMRMTKRLHDAGVRVLPGTDHPIPVMIPGASLHEELALLVRAGLTNAEALRAGTFNPAVYLGMTDSLGTIARGKIAELVLLDANPLENIRNVARVNSVWRGGRYLSRATLDEMLARLTKP